MNLLKSTFSQSERGYTNYLLVVGMLMGFHWVLLFNFPMPDLVNPSSDNKQRDVVSGTNLYRF